MNSTQISLHFLVFSESAKHGTTIQIRIVDLRYTKLYLTVRTNFLNDKSVLKNTMNFVLNFM